MFDLSWCVLSPAGPSSPTVTVSVVQSVVFGSPGPAGLASQTHQKKPQGCSLGPDPVPESLSETRVVQQRLDQTSTCLAAALKAVERNLDQDQGSG